MPSVHRIMLKQQGYPGAPGWTAFHFAHSSPADEPGQFDAVHAFLVAIKPFFPGAWSGQIESAGQVLDSVTGALVSFSTVPAGDAAFVSGSSASPFGAGVAGAVLALNTTTINWTRRVRGRIFLVPIVSSGYDDRGTLADSLIGDLTAAGNALRTSAANWCVWSRPRSGAGGALAPVTSVNVNDQAAFLSSRRS